MCIFEVFLSFPGKFWGTTRPSAPALSGEPSGLTWCSWQMKGEFFIARLVNKLLRRIGFGTSSPLEQAVQKHPRLKTVIFYFFFGKALLLECLLTLYFLNAKVICIFCIKFQNKLWYNTEEIKKIPMILSPQVSLHSFPCILVIYNNIYTLHTVL